MKFGMLIYKEYEDKFGGKFDEWRWMAELYIYAEKFLKLETLKNSLTSQWIKNLNQYNFQQLVMISYLRKIHGISLHWTNKSQKKITVT